jgi:transcriptional regulator with XRE-family HTH domain
MNYLSSNASDTHSSPSPSVKLPKATFGALLRRWRVIRRLSQLNLALDAEISIRHLSCLERGRAQPSREMVLRLAEALQVPVRERNALLLAGGYAPIYRHTRLDTMELEGARHALDLLMRQQEPYPAFVVDRYWNILRMNDGMQRFLGLFLGCDGLALGNPIRLVFHPQGLRPFIQNWENVAARLMRRVHREAAANPCDEKMKAFLDELLSYPGVPARWRLLDFDGTAPPFLTIDYRWKHSTLRLFSMITTFGTAQDIELQELRIESFFPADETTRAALSTI